MNHKKLRFIENMIIVTFPIILFAGCAGSDVKPSIEENPMATYSDYENPLPENDLMEISTAYQAPNESKLIISEDSSSSELSETIKTSLNDTEIVKHDSSPNTPVSDTAADEENYTQSIIHATNSTPALPINNLLSFDTDKHTLADEQRTELKQHAEFLLAHPDMILVINGHADVRGTEGYNQVLSEKRAQAVYDLLIDLGVSQGQLKIFGFGEHQPMHDKNDWDENRRVELEFQDPVLLSSMQ
jgi:outer membrane protein OmpA-like peptidoglycan-associated protein